MRLESLLAVLLLSSTAFPISRVGNNKVVTDSLNRFSSAIPSDFSDLTENRGGGATLASGVYMVNPSRPVEIQMMRFHSAFPQLAHKGLGELEHYFLSETDAHYETVQGKTKGAVTLIGGGLQDLTGIAICTDGLGVVIFAPDIEMTRTAMLEILKSTTFEKPCSK